jgi:hypothetical protein
MKGAPLKIGGLFGYDDHIDRIKWNLKGWIDSVKISPNLFVPFILNKTGDIDVKYLTPEVMSMIRKNSPEVFNAISKKIGDGASTLADLGEVGF